MPQKVIENAGDAHLNINYYAQTAAELAAVSNGYGRLQLYKPAIIKPIISIPADGNTVYFNTGANFGIGTDMPSYMLDVNGTPGFLNQPVIYSDSTLKTNIQPLSADWASSRIMALRPVSYEWIVKKDTAMTGTKYGFTAQQVQTVLPDLVKTDSFGIKTLQYDGLIAILTKAIQQQQAQIDSLKAVMTSCCSNNARTANSSGKSANTIEVELSDADAIVLDQNSPNPFAEQTTISYNIPKSVNAAMILFYDINGRQIKSVEISKKGKGQLNVFANDLSNGVYSYTLVADGKIIETKKMIKQQ